MQVNPYLTFDGTCAEAFRFYERALGGSIGMMMTVGQSPMADSATPETRDRIMHASMTVGDTSIMGSDVPAHMLKTPQGIRLNLQFEDVTEAERVFHTLCDGGQVEMPLEETFWAKRFGLLTDRFGTPWMINCSKPM